MANNYIGAYPRSRTGSTPGDIGAWHYQKTWAFANSIGAYNHDGLNDIGAYEGTVFVAATTTTTRTKRYRSRHIGFHNV